MMRLLVSTLLVTAAFAAFTPTASATCIDTAPDDNGVGPRDCNLPVAGELDCQVLVYGSLPGLGGSCMPVCVRECFPVDCVQDCDGPADSLMMAGPCSNDLNPTDDNGVTVRCTVAGVTCRATALSYGPFDLDPVDGPYCSGPIYCVTDPCWYWL